MSRPAKNTEVAPLIDPAIDQEKMTDAMQAMREQAQEDGATVFKIGQQVGALQATRMWSTAFRAAELKMFSELRALPVETVRKIPIQVDGSLRRAERASELCELVFGRSYSKLAEEAQNLGVLGDDAYELATGLGLNRSNLRAVRALPPEKLEVVRNAISSGSAKSEVLAVIEDLAEKVQKAEDTTAETKAEVAAKEKLLADKNQQIDSLRTELTLKKNLVIAPTDWPERFKGLMDQAQFAHKNIKLHISGLEAIREAALQTAPENPEDEASLDRARTVLADELVAIHRQCAEYLEALGLKFNKTLGGYASEGLWK